VSPTKSGKNATVPQVIENTREFAFSKSKFAMAVENCETRGNFQRRHAAVRDKAFEPPSIALTA
jgi:hypothetical protein